MYYLIIIISATPQLPLLTGPTKMVAGTSLTWSCVSIGGFPQQQMSMRIGSTDLSNFLTINAVYDANTKLYRVTGTLAWAPSISHDGEVLSCDVYHQQTLGNVPQTASLRELDVQGSYYRYLSSILELTFSQFFKEVSMTDTIHVTSNSKPIIFVEYFYSIFVFIHLEKKISLVLRQIFEVKQANMRVTARNMIKVLQ